MVFCFVLFLIIVTLTGCEEVDSPQPDTSGSVSPQAMSETQEGAAFPLEASVNAMKFSFKD